MQLCTFQVAGHLFGVDVLTVQEVIREHAVTHVPLAPDVVRGLINLRGNIVPTLDLRHRMGLVRYGAGEPYVNVVTQTAAGVVSLMADEIGDVVETGSTQLDAPPATLPPQMRGLIRHVCQLSDSLLLVLDPDRVVELDEARTANAMSYRDAAAV